MAEAAEQPLEEYKPGRRIRLIHMDDYLDPIPDGTTGTIERIQSNTPMRLRNSKGEIFVNKIVLDIDWDISRTLPVMIPPDEIEIIDAT